MDWGSVFCPITIFSGGARSLSLNSNGGQPWARFMAEWTWKDQVYAPDKWAALVQLRWVFGAIEHYAGNHGMYGSADRNLEWIRRSFGNLLSFAWRWYVDLVASLYFLHSRRWPLLQKAKKCRLNQPGWTRRHSAKGKQYLLSTIW